MRRPQRFLSSEMSVICSATEVKALRIFDGLNLMNLKGEECAPMSARTHRPEVDFELMRMEDTGLRSAVRGRHNTGLGKSWCTVVRVENNTAINK